MSQLLIKIFISALLIAAISEVARRSTLLGALLASLPVTSLLAFVWLYRDTGNTAKVAALSADIFWLVLPSLVLFVVLPMLLRNGWNFWLSLGLSCAATAVSYGGVVLALRAWRA